MGGGGSKGSAPSTGKESSPHNSGGGRTSDNRSDGSSDRDTNTGISSVSRNNASDSFGGDSKARNSKSPKNSDKSSVHSFLATSSRTQSFPNPVRSRLPLSLSSGEGAVLALFSAEFREGNAGWKNKSLDVGGVQVFGLAVKKATNFKSSKEDKAAEKEAERRSNEERKAQCASEKSGGRASPAGLAAADKRGGDVTPRPVSGVATPSAEGGGEAKLTTAEEERGRKPGKENFTYRGGGGSAVGERIPLGREEQEFQHSTWQNEVRL